MPIDYDRARVELRTAFQEAEDALVSGVDLHTPSQQIVTAVRKLFSSGTQAFREAMLGCLLVRIQDKTVNIRRPYVSQGDDSYNGRTMDERVVNPLLQEKRIPSSRGPFLSVLS